MQPEEFKRMLDPIVRWHRLTEEQVSVLQEEFMRVDVADFEAACTAVKRSRNKPTISDFESAISAGP